MSSAVQVRAKERTAALLAVLLPIAYFKLKKFSPSYMSSQGMSVRASSNSRDKNCTLELRSIFEILVGSKVL
ncbi:MAG: hypothetical protein WBQ25_17090 [Nitrososphaeraceae archaeon]